MATPAAAINESKLQAFMEKMLGDFGAIASAPLVRIGEKLGLWKAMAGAGPLTSAQLAEKTSTSERYVREWLAAQASGGYIEYDAATGTYTLPPEQAMALAVEDSPVFALGLFQVAEALSKDESTILEAFRTGKGVGWHEHDHNLFQGVARFFQPNYVANLVANWIPALDGVKDKLEKGCRVADIGCGHGISTILMAKAFPKSTFFGFDYHPASIETAREAAKQAGVAERTTFQTATAKDFSGPTYDFVTAFDCLHDMGDPVGAAKHVREVIAPDGTWMIIEPFANDKLEENLNPLGRIFYSASTMICTPASRAQEVGLALGAQAGEARLREVLTGGGFTRFRRATETPFNLVLEARP